MRSRRTKPVRISVSEEEEEDSSNNGGSSRPQASCKSSNQMTNGRKSTNNCDTASFKKRPPLKKKQVKTSFGPEDSATGVEDSAPDLEDYIAIDKESKDLAYSGYDIEGKYFRLETTVIMSSNGSIRGCWVRRRTIAHCKYFQSSLASVYELTASRIPSDEEEEDEWEHSQIQKAVGTNKSDLPRPTTEVPEMAPIPSISEVLGDLKSILSNLEIKKNDHSEQLEDLKTDLERIQDKEKSLQETLDKAAEDYNLAQSSLNR
ncbi:hypothetical protein TRICI_004678 [Trichomonascus ciferrii]|uniref:Uncharacterized protein n=1 Tax=Trichomonascus ciferrii TaxID=44093 RepID=A0A642V0C9_9ASCO|nr:hypothetical protein TRICI_004678 [Trichomonascus ciferrii]